MTDPSPPDATSSPQPHTEPPRRNFLAEAASLIIGGLVGLVPLGAGIAFFMDPLLRKRQTMRGQSEDGFLPVAKLSDLPTDGTPLRFSIIADKIDAWNLFKKQTVGTVYLRNVGGNVIAFNDVCPHLGCKIDYKGSNKSFFCPCHASAFELDGKKANPIPPRDMDGLDVHVDPNGEIWVKYQNFKRGIEQKEPLS